MTSNFAFLLENDRYDFFSRACIEAETALKSSNAQCAIACRRALELAVKWNYSADRQLKFPSREGLTCLIDNAPFQRVVGKALHEKLTYIVKLGNVAAHTSQTIERQEAVESLKGLFDYVLYLDYCYGDRYQNRRFDEQLLPDLFDEMVSDEAIDDRVSESEINEYLQMIKKLQRELAKAKSMNTKVREYTLSPTDYFKKTELNLEIELKDLGYHFDNEIHREKGFGYRIAREGKTIALIEFESTIREFEKGKKQAERFAKKTLRLEGVYPVVFLFDGYRTWLKSDRNAEYSEVFSVFNMEEITNMIANRQRRYPEGKRLPDLLPFQQDAVNAVYHTFNNGKNKALLCMAYGTGKTTIAKALIQELSRERKVVFIAENESLALDAYHELKESMRVSLLTKQQLHQSNILITYYSEISDAIDDYRTKMSKRLITPHFFDVIILDDISNRIMKNNRNLLNYFYGNFIGLTTMAKEDLGAEIFDFFGAERPAFEYDYFSALYRDRMIVGYQLVSVQYSSMAERDMLERILFEEKPLDKAVDIICENILSDGKTLIFTGNVKQAAQLKEAFYSQTARYHPGQVEILDAHSSNKEQFKNIAGSIRVGITYGELERGVNIPDIFNIVLFKQASSKNELLQMIGRGARTFPGKDHYRVLDFFRNFEDYSLSAENISEGSLNEMLFIKRIQLIYEIQNYESTDFELEEFRNELAQTVYRQVIALDPFSYEVRYVKPLVERFSQLDSFLALSKEDRDELCTKLAPVITLEDSDVFAKRFDNLVYALILEYIQTGQVNQNLRLDITKTAILLLKIPRQKKIEKNKEVIAALQSEQFWEHFDIIALENARRKLRDCVYLIYQKADKLRFSGEDMKIQKNEQIQFYL